ncbi:hypothetical protein GCM10027068_25810 [Prescottella soli]
MARALDSTVPNSHHQATLVRADRGEGLENAALGLRDDDFARSQDNPAPEGDVGGGYLDRITDGRARVAPTRS